MNEAQKQGLLMAGANMRIQSALTYDVNNSDREYQCITFTNNAYPAGDITIDLDPTETTSVANNKLGWEQIESITIQGTEGTTEVAINNLPSCPVLTGVTSEGERPVVATPNVNVPTTFMEPTAVSEIVLHTEQSVDSITYTTIYGYAKKP